MVGEVVGLVAQFIKNPRGRLDMFSLTVFETAIGFDHKPYVTRREYDVDHSKKYGYLFDMSGFGGDDKVIAHGIYFAFGDVVIEEAPTTLVDSRDSPPWDGKKTLTIRARNRTRRLDRLPRAFSGYGQNVLEWLRCNGIEEHAVWCSECADSVPGDELCAHCWWCEKSGWYSTPDERCGCADRRECEGED